MQQPEKITIDDVRNAARRIDEVIEGFYSVWGKAREAVGAEPTQRQYANAYKVFVSFIDDDTLTDIYHKLSLKHHPDHGGDPDKMRILNVVWDAIKKERESRK